MPLPNCINFVPSVAVVSLPPKVPILSVALSEAEAARVKAAAARVKAEAMSEAAVEQAEKVVH